MAHAVAEQGEPALHEEDADERGDQADERGGDERPAHEVEVEEGAHGSSPTTLGASPVALVVVDVVVQVLTGHRAAARRRRRISR